MKNYDYWSSFTNTGKIDDYLHYIACTREDCSENPIQNTPVMGKAQYQFLGKRKEGGLIAGINCCDRDGSIGHAGR